MTQTAHRAVTDAVRVIAWELGDVVHHAAGASLDIRKGPRRVAIDLSGDEISTRTPRHIGILVRARLEAALAEERNLDVV